MKHLLVAALIMISNIALAKTKSEQPNFSCTAQVHESFSDGSVRQEKIPLNVEMDNPSHIILTADLDNRAYSFNGPKEGPYFVSITEGPDYTKGSISTAEFSAQGRLQLSTVNGPLVHKIECYKNP